MITSTRNPQIKWVRLLQDNSRERRKEKAFVVEGVRLAEEALASGLPVKLVLYTDNLSERGKKVVDAYNRQKAPVELVSPNILHEVSDTETPQGLLVVSALPEFLLPDTLDFVFIPDLIRDPGNLGTMLRTAAAAGVQAILIPPGTVDPYSPKVVRASMGALFHIPIRIVDWEFINNMVQQHHLKVYLAAASEGKPHTEIDFTAPSAIIVGGEASGPSSEANRTANLLVTIPMPGKSESLNAGIAAGILFFEVVRQRISRSSA